MDIVADNHNFQIKMELFKGEPYIHCEMHLWSHGLYKKYLKVLHDLKVHLKEQGFTKMYTALKKTDTKGIKFNNMFGFEQVDETETQVILSQEL